MITWWAIIGVLLRLLRLQSTPVLAPFGHSHDRHLARRALAAAACDPYPCLHGGAFVAPPVAASPDPLAPYAWNWSDPLLDPLAYQQYYDAAVDAVAEAGAANFSGLGSLVHAACNASAAPGACAGFARVVVRGPTRSQLMRWNGRQ